MKEQDKKPETNLQGTLKAVLVFIALVLFALVIWFVGPLVAFDNLRPLESVGMRVTTILLTLALVLFVLADWPVSIIGLTAACILIWYASPLLQFGASRPFETELSRSITIGVLVLVYLVWAVYRILQILRRNPEKLDKVLNFKKKSTENKETEEAIKEVTGIANRAVSQLRKMRTTAKGLARVFEGKRYLYELPWYMVVGNPGAGKTTALVNSGLKFPLAEQMGGSVLRGQNGGTANCYWWLTNEAVLIDTAGRYANHADGGSGLAQNDAEWKGFLKVVRSQRPRAPINGVLAMVNVADLLNNPASERTQIAADLRARLADLREELGIRFPVYVVLTKMDLIAGFEAYFSTLTTEARNQVWGFTLPYGEETGIDKNTLKARCVEELELLVQRLDAGVNARLIEEFDVQRRHRLALLPQELAALIEPLTDLLEAMFLDSRYDNTQNFTTLRGVYFTSASQAQGALVVDRNTLWQRVLRAFTGKTPELQNAEVGRMQGTGNRSYFLYDLLSKLIFAESHLVRPNLTWEFRYKVLRIVGHVLVGFVFVWLLSGVWVSSSHNHEYLNTSRARAELLREQVRNFYAKPNNAQVPDLLSDAAALPAYNGLDPSNPPGSWGYGLYAVDTVMQAGNVAYAALADRLLLPYVVHRMETALEDALNRQDESEAYAALRVYLQMNEKSAYVASEVREWAVNDWTASDSSAVFGGKASMLQHLQKLFDGSRVVQSPFVKNDALIGRARAFLDKKPSLTRIYERLKSEMQAKAPDGVTLMSAVGPQAATVFARKSGKPLEQGVPGLFTYAGYHELFQKQISQSLKSAYLDDAWVMGRGKFLSEEEKKNELPSNKQFEANGSLANEVRRLYLAEYAKRWEDFLDDVQPLSGATLAFNLQIVRAFAAPDSPLMRLAQVAVKETTLGKKSDANKSLFDKVAQEADKKSEQAKEAFGIGNDFRIERQTVDNRFAALREIIAGMEQVNGMIDAYYTQLVVADNALTSGAVPPVDSAGSKLRLQAAKMPAPLRGVLIGLVTEGTRGVGAGVGDILITQAEGAVGEYCRKAIAGKYPFTSSEQDVDPDDFVRLFSQGGLIDDFFQKKLQPYVNTATKPWQYKQESPDMPPIAGPALDNFARAQQIRDAFFRDPSGKKMGWKADIRVLELDPNITDLIMDIDGQVQRYIHGPVASWSVEWPGPRGGLRAEMIANPRVKNESSKVSMQGPWAIFRLIDAGKSNSTASTGKTAWEYEFDGRRTQLEINTGVQGRVINNDLLKGFKCPGKGA